MAYMNQDRKAKIAAELKRVIPKSWKWSLAVRHSSTIVLTIAAAPVDLVRGIPESEYFKHSRGYCGIGRWEMRDALYDAETRAVLDAIFTALHRGNHNRSDITTDYFDVGWYVQVGAGRWDKPFVVTSAVQPQAVAA